MLLPRLACGLLLLALLHPGHTAAQGPAPRHGMSHPSAGMGRRGDRPDVARFRQRVVAALSASGPDKGYWGVLIIDAASGQTLFSQNADSYFIPASNAKLFTTALALATLGPDYRVTTTLSSAGSVDTKGLLSGDLILIGRGDANLSNRKFPYEKKAERDGPPEKVLAELADALVARGIKEIAGDVVADDSMFQPEPFPSGWAIDDMLWSYGAAVSAVVINDNTFSIELRPGKNVADAASITIQPQADYYTVENLVRTAPAGSEETLAVVREPGSHLVQLSGTMPLGGAPHRLTIAVEQPAEYAAKLLQQLLQARGVKISGTTRARHAVDPLLANKDRPAETVLAEHVSVPLAEEVRAINKESLNLHAELLLRLAAYEKVRASNYRDANKFAADFYQSAGIAAGDVVLQDGSGLSRRDLVMPRALVQILKYASAQPWGELYRSSLPVAGEDGTLAEHMKNTSAAGRIFAKTGTVEHIAALSGYATTRRGENLIFSIMGNNNNLHAQAAHEVVDAMAVAMTEEDGVATEIKRKK
jgi:D-alanyl-D-alanine carboxypeptidase/D-alanyl-D-alanine-endopeptidase (penicillin-binding protein 4)